ncbi:PAS domain S-box protein [Desulfogranum japonicum]|uniref:PAS domain S-box protein n=1 Tax=Desulfogranum japonicum TaxID=231447 RepID=UPI00040934A4|nr:PAS domain S-box protein [Desulfogranum japonicum]
MRRWKGYTIIGVVCLFYWVLDSIWSYLSFENNLKNLIFSEPSSYLDTFLLRVPPYQTVSRIMVVFLFISLGILIFEFIKKQKESEKRYRSLFEFMEEGFIRAATDGNITMANMAIAKMCGFTSPKELIGRNIAAMYADPNSREELIHTLREKGVLYDRDILLRRRDGTQFWSSSTIKIIHDEHGTTMGTEGLVRDISDRKHAEQRIEHLNRVLRSIRTINQLIVRERDPETLIHEGCRLLVDNRGYASALIFLTDEKDRIVTWAGSGPICSPDKIDAMLRRREAPPCCALSRSANGVVVIDSLQDLCGSCPIAGESQQPTSLCIRLAHDANTFGYLIAVIDDDIEVEAEELDLFTEMAGDLAYALNFIRLGTDHKILERKRKTLEQQLFQAQKMESVGRLAGGVAHDYNNMLSIIIGYAESSLDSLDPEDPLYDDITEILDAGKRSADITRQLLAFAREQTTAPKVLQLNDTIENMLKMLRRLIGEDIDLAWRPGSKVWPVKIDPSQIDQILANLCVNSRDAINGVGQITIETKNVSFDEEYCADHAGFIPGDYIMLAVSDNGSGMDPETLEKVFEPFFTTKELHQGTGLGLSTVYGIVKQNNGFINVYSEPEKGTTIKSYLLRYTGEPITISHGSDQKIPLSKGETILLVEDDKSILKLGERMLNSLGYKVLPASTPSEAIRLAEKHSNEINLLITDVVMPEMNGRELSEQLERQYSHLRTLFMSGYTANVIAHRGVLDDGVIFLSKPLSKKELAAKIREAMNR